MGKTRRRHYILTMQLQGGPQFHVHQSDGVFEGDSDEMEAFDMIRANRCSAASASTGLEWNAGNTMILFYRLADLP